MTVQHIDVVLVDRTKKIDPALLHNAALSLNAQITQHLPAVWPGIAATVSAAPSVGALPPNAWPVFLVATLPPGEGGFHMDKHNQPYSKVIATPADPTWTIDASHEILEMLVDPNGNRMHTSQAIAIQGDGVVDGRGPSTIWSRPATPARRTTSLMRSAASPSPTSSPPTSTTPTCNRGSSTVTGVTSPGRGKC